MALTPKQLSDLRGAYLRKREELLRRKVDAISVTLFERVFNDYLARLEQSDGKLVYNERNISIVRGLDAIYNAFITGESIPIVKQFVGDLQKVPQLNERYFKRLLNRDVRDSTIKVQATVNKRLGIAPGGAIETGGFVDKFISDKSLLKELKRETTKAITGRMGFQEFRQTLKEKIIGNPELKVSGGLQKYYRNYAYDTYMQVDRMNQDLFAKDLGLRFFIWTGGVIKTSRPLCVVANDKVVDSERFKNLRYSDIKKKYRDGLDEDWNPVSDLGQHGCRHYKSYILETVAKRLVGRELDIKEIANV